MNKKVVFFAVHPDDETLGCGGAILKHKSEGDKIYWVIITSLVGDSRWTPSEQERRKEIIEDVKNAYGFEGVYDLKFPPAKLDEQGIGQLIVKIGKVLDAIQPDTIYSMFRSDVHTDHRVAFNALYSCAKSFRRPFIKALLMAEVPSETDFAVPHPSTAFIPNVFVDISDTLNKKIKALSVFKSQLSEFPDARSLEAVEALAKYRGALMHFKAAEAFMLIRQLL